MTATSSLNGNRVRYYSGIVLFSSVCRCQIHNGRVRNTDPPHQHNNNLSMATESVRMYSSGSSPKIFASEFPLVRQYHIRDVPWWHETSPFSLLAAAANPRLPPPVLCKSWSMSIRVHAAKRGRVHWGSRFVSHPCMRCATKGCCHRDEHEQTHPAKRFCALQSSGRSFTRAALGRLKAKPACSGAKQLSLLSARAN